MLHSFIPNQLVNIGRHYALLNGVIFNGNKVVGFDYHNTNIQPLFTVANFE